MRAPTAAPAGAPIASAGLPVPGQRRGDGCSRPERCHAEDEAEAGPRREPPIATTADAPHAPRAAAMPPSAMTAPPARAATGARARAAALAGPPPSPPASASANAISDGPTTITAPTAGTRQWAITTLAARTGAAAIWPPSAERSGSETARPLPATTAASIGPATTASATPPPLAPASSSASACPTRQNPNGASEDPHSEASAGRGDAATMPSRRRRWQRATASQSVELIPDPCRRPVSPSAARKTSSSDAASCRARSAPGSPLSMTVPRLSSTTSWQALPAKWRSCVASRTPEPRAASAATASLRTTTASGSSVAVASSTRMSGGASERPATALACRRSPRERVPSRWSRRWSRPKAAISTEARAAASSPARQSACTSVTSSATVSSSNPAGSSGTSTVAARACSEPTGTPDDVDRASVDRRRARRRREAASSCRIRSGRRGRPPLPPRRRRSTPARATVPP